MHSEAMRYLILDPRGHRLGMAADMSAARRQAHTDHGETYAYIVRDDPGGRVIMGYRPGTTPRGYERMAERTAQARRLAS